MGTSGATPASTRNMVCRFRRWIEVAAGLTPTSTIASSGTSDPLGARTMKVDRSSTPYLSEPAKRTLTGISTSSRWKSRSDEPRRAMLTNCATCSALKP